VNELDETMSHFHVTPSGPSWSSGMFYDVNETFFTLGGLRRPQIMNGDISKDIRFDPQSKLFRQWAHLEIEKMRNYLLIYVDYEKK